MKLELKIGLDKIVAKNIPFSVYIFYKGDIVATHKNVVSYDVNLDSAYIVLINSLGVCGSLKYDNLSLVKFSPDSEAKPYISFLIS